jgi:hypothetical protein
MGTTVWPENVDSKAEDVTALWVSNGKGIKAMTHSAGACTRDAAEEAGGTDNGAEPVVVAQQSNCAHEQQAQVSILSPAPLSPALAN